MNHASHGSTGNPLRVVLDTNVYITVFNFPSSPLQQIWHGARDGRFLLFSSPAIIREFARVVRHHFAWNERRISVHVRLLSKAATVLSPRFLPDAIPEDPADNHILACAVEGHADLIVSGDKDLLRLGTYRGIPIVRPMEFLRTLGG